MISTDVPLYYKCAIYSLSWEVEFFAFCVSTVTSTPSVVSPYVTRMTKLLSKSSTPGTNNTLLAKFSGVNLNNSSSATSTVKDTTEPAALTNTVDGIALPAVGVTLDDLEC